MTIEDEMIKKYEEFIGKVLLQVLEGRIDRDSGEIMFNTLSEELRHWKFIRDSIPPE